MHELIHANAPFLGAWVLTSIGIVALALLIERRVNAPAATRHLLLFASMLMPAVLAPLALIEWREPVAAVASVTSEAGAVRAAPATVEHERDYVCALAALWAAGTILALLRTARDTQRWREARRQAVPVSDRAMPIDHPVEISNACREPAVAGIFDPTILLPAGEYLDALTDDELETVLTHELEHVRRHDNLRALIAQTVCTFFWFSPVHRLARRRLVELRERACDAAVLARGCEPDSYLSALAKSCTSSFQGSAVASMSRMQLRERMESIMTLDTQSSRGMSWAVRVGIVAAAGIIITAFALFAPSPLLLASSPSTPPGSFSADVWVRPTPGGQHFATIKFEAPDGAFTTVAMLQSLPDERTITSVHGGRVYKVVVHTNADASGSADVEVREGDQIVWTTVRTFAAVAPMKKAAALPETESGSSTSKYQRITPGMKPPKVLTRVEPLYPAAAKEDRIAGVVILEALINESGVIDDVHVLKPLPYGLDQAAVDAVKQWTFEPATVDGKPVPVIFNVTINFRLDE
ncbi:MAG TPA: M56 family metallopeptidase [Thermoanaerobaculia bacterium]|nr:M56 family metallopeptidase [Thermoanaerobaculia bacterium]